MCQNCNQKIKVFERVPEKGFETGPEEAFKTVTEEVFGHFDSIQTNQKVNIINDQRNGEFKCDNCGNPEKYMKNICEEHKFCEYCFNNIIKTFTYCPICSKNKSYCDICKKFFLLVVINDGIVCNFCGSNYMYCKICARYKVPDIDNEHSSYHRIENNLI